MTPTTTSVAFWRETAARALFEMADIPGAPTWPDLEKPTRQIYRETAEDISALIAERLDERGELQGTTKVSL